MRALGEEVVGATAAERRRKEAAKRQRKFGGAPRVTAVEMGITEENSIALATRESYTKAVDKFLSFAGLTSLSMAAAALDALLVRYYDEKFLEGKGVGTGTRLLSAIQYVMPVCSLRGALHLPRAGRSLKGWARLAPGTTRQPLPWMVCAALALYLLRGSSVEHCLAWLLMVDCYLRPSEALRLKKQQFVMPAAGHTDMAKVALHLNPQELRVRSKTGELDESVIVNRVFLSRCLEVYTKKQVAGPIFRITLWEMRLAFLQAAGRLGLGKFGPVLYMGRHSGASNDALNGVPIADVKRRGRWRTDSSLRRYEKRALVQLVLQKMSPAERANCHRAAAQLEDELARACIGARQTHRRLASGDPSGSSCLLAAAPSRE